MSACPTCGRDEVFARITPDMLLSYDEARRMVYGRLNPPPRDEPKK